MKKLDNKQKKYIACRQKFKTEYEAKMENQSFCPECGEEGMPTHMLHSEEVLKMFGIEDYYCITCDLFFNDPLSVDETDGCTFTHNWEDIFRN
jgi:hypothetical protein